MMSLSLLAKTTKKLVRNMNSFLWLAAVVSNNASEYLISIRGFVFLRDILYTQRYK